MNGFTTFSDNHKVSFQREKRKDGELRGDFKAFRGIRPFREIHVRNHYFI
jgi:hypothetical protein